MNITLPAVQQAASLQPQVAASSQRVNAYNIARALMGHVAFRVVGGGLYAFTGWIYELMDPSSAFRLILRYCRSAAKEYGDGHIIRKIHDVILMEPEIVKKRVDISNDFITFRNGVLEVSSGHLFSHSADYFDTAYLEVDYDPSEQYSIQFDAFLYRLANGDQTIITRMRKR